MSSKEVVIVVGEGELLLAVDRMCSESLPPDLHNMWEEVRDCLVCTRGALSHLAPSVGEIAELIKSRETAICKVAK